MVRSDNDDEGGCGATTSLRITIIRRYHKLGVSGIVSMEIIFLLIEKPDVLVNMWEYY